MKGYDEQHVLDPMEFKGRFEGEYVVREVMCDGVLLSGVNILAEIKFWEGNKAVEMTFGKGLKIVKIHVIFDTNDTEFAYDREANNVFITRKKAREGEPAEISFSLETPR